VTRADHTLVVRLDNAGDVLLTGPAVRAVAAGSRRVTYLAGPRGAEAAAMLPGVDEVLQFDAPWVGYSPCPTSRVDIDGFVSAIARGAAQRALIFTSFHQSALPIALLLRMAGVPWIGAISTDYPGSLLDLRLDPPENAHEVERSLSLAAHAGFPLPARDNAQLSLRDFRMIASEKRSYYVVHPGASVPTRALGRVRARELVAALCAAGDRVVVTGERSESALVREVATVGGSLAMPRVTTSLHELGGVISGGAAIICGNTGPAHLAAAVGTPVVSVFAPVVPVAQWRPWKVPNVIFGDQDIACAGCRARQCPIPGQPCLEPVDAVALAHAARDLADCVRSSPAFPTRAPRVRSLGVV
jgi:ADP-heptose:LPS heptosyltransferase